MNSVFKFFKVEKLFHNQIWLYSWLLFVTSLILEITYSFRYYRSVFNSDSAAYNLFALQMHLEKSLLPKGWFYANGDLFFFSPHLLMFILNFWFDNQFLIHGLGVFVFFMVFLYSLYHLLRTMGFESNKSFLALGIFSASTTISVREFLYGQGAYIGLYILTVWILISTINIIRPGNSSRTTVRHQISLLFSLLLFTITNPVRSVPGAIVPIIAILLIKNFSSHNLVRDLLKELKKFLVPLVGILLGIVGYIFLTSSLQMENGVNTVPTRDFNSNAGGLEIFFNGIFFITGVAPGANNRQLSLEVVASFIRLFLVVFAVIGFSRLLKQRNSAEKYASIYFAVIFIPSAYLMVFSGLAIDYTAGRYVMIPILTVLLFGLLKSIVIFNAKFGKVLVLCSSVLLLSNLYTTNSDKNLAVQVNDAKIVSGLQKYNNLSASYWNASKYQVLSNGNLVIQPIKWDSQSCISPYPWLTSEAIVFPKNRSRELVVFPNEFANLISTVCAEKINMLRKTPEYWLVSIEY